MLSSSWSLFHQCLLCFKSKPNFEASGFPKDRFCSFSSFLCLALETFPAQGHDGLWWHPGERGLNLCEWLSTGFAEHSRVIPCSSTGCSVRQKWCSSSLPGGAVGVIKHIFTVVQQLMRCQEHCSLSLSASSKKDGPQTLRIKSCKPKPGQEVGGPLSDAANACMGNGYKGRGRGQHFGHGANQICPIRSPW